MMKKRLQQGPACCQKTVPHRKRACISKPIIQTIACIDQRERRAIPCPRSCRYINRVWPR